MKRFLFLMMFGCASLVGQLYAYYNEESVPYQYAPRCENCCCWRFEGLYLGGNIGWAFHNHTWVDRDTWVNNFGPNWAIGSACSTYNDVTVGFQTGYNYQCGCVLYGLEVDASWANLEKSKRFSHKSIIGPELVEAGRVTFHDRLNAFGTIRGRAGVIVNNFLFFATAGAGWANFRQQWTFNDLLDNFSERFSARNVRWGLALGVGVEWMMCSNFSFKAEGLCLRFPEHRVSGFSPANEGTVHFDLLNTVWVARVGFNYNLYALCAR